jgi:L-fuconolactonase
VRRIAYSYATVAAAVLCTSAFGDDKPTRIIDTHIHLYDTEREQGVPWPNENSGHLYKPHLPADFNRVAQPLGVTDAVSTEASHWVEDNQWSLDLVKDDDFYIGVIGNLHPAAEDFAKNLERFARDPRYVGIRVRNNDIPFELTPQAIENLKLLAARDMTVDFLVGTASLETIEQLAAKIPDLKIVINHCAGYQADGKPVDEKWQRQIEAAAKHKNVYCKFSGMLEHAKKTPAPRDVEYYRPMLDVLWNAFGQQRLIHASNWPVVNGGGDYQQHLKLCYAYLRPKGREAMERVFWKNAVEVYGLRLPTRK